MRKNKLSIIILSIFSALYSINSYALPYIIDKAWNAVLDINFPPMEKKNYNNDFPMTNPQQKIKHKEFKNFVAFGDSLSDVGSYGRKHRYLAGGFNNTMGTEILSEYYTGKPSTPPTQGNILLGGQNYAQTGAVAAGINHPKNGSVEAMINEYLKFNNITNNKVDPENLYFIWIGAMDINLDLLNKPLSILTYDFKAPDYTINIAPLEVVKQTQRLINMGAKYTIVVNLPDSATAPITSVFYTDVINSALQSIPIVKNFSELYFSKRRAQVDNFLRNPANRIHINNDSGKEYLIENGILGMQKLYFFLPKSLVRQLYMFAYNIQSDLTRQFSNTLNENLAKIDGPVVYVDFRTANYELIDDPQKFGIDDIISPTCTLGYSARLCDTDSSKYFNDKVYLTSDWFHPSPYANRLLADYLISIFDAPLYASSIIKHQSIINDLRSNFLQDQLNILQYEEHEVNDIMPILGLSANYSKKDNSYLENKNDYVQNLNVGFAYYLNNNNLLGAMLNAGYGKYRPHDNFNYHYNNQSLTLFSHNQFNDNLWLNANAYLGRLSASHITRTIPLGYFAKEIQHSSTHGKSFGLEALLGYDLKFNNDNTLVSPIAGVSLNSFNANKYKENSTRSNAMHFDPERFKSDYINLGWQTTHINPIVNTSIQFTINKRISNKPIVINGAINSTKTSFFREYKYNKYWANIQATLNKNIGHNTNISFNIGYHGQMKKETNKEQNFNFSLGINSKF